MSDHSTGDGDHRPTIRRLTQMSNALAANDFCSPQVNCSSEPRNEKSGPLDRSFAKHLYRLAVTGTRSSIYREYSSTMSCSFTTGAISSREGTRATDPLKASRFTVNQSGTGEICVRSRFRVAN